MNDQPKGDQRILEALEACRPGSDDLHDPGLAYLAAALAADAKLQDLYRRSQQVDAAVAAGFRDAPVPDGLQRRLLERLGAATAEDATSSGDQRSPDGDPAGPQTPASRRWLSPRWLPAYGLAVGTAAAVMIAVFYWLGMSPSQEDSTQMVLEEAIKVFIDEAGADQQFVNRQACEEYPISRAVVSAAGTPWRPLRDFVGRRGAAYDLSRGGVRATLYVLAEPVSDLPPMPPMPPSGRLHTTRGCSTAAWLENGRMCVLVVEHDNPQVFWSFLKPRTLA